MSSITRIYRRRNAIASVVLITITIAMYGQYDTIHRNLANRNLTERPVMNTYIDESQESNPSILALWHKEWGNAGFNTKVLTLKDARRHPKFEEMEKVIEGHATGDVSSTYYRWLAMSASGGGWMSTYDTFPTKFPLSDGIDLPNDGTFTSFHGHIPVLVSASEDEWDRVIELLLNAIPMIPGKKKSDRFALKVLRDEDTHGIQFLNSDFNVQRGFAYDSPRQVNCDKMSRVRAVHISLPLTKSAVDNGLYPMELIKDEQNAIDFSHRAEAYNIFLEDWKSQCREKVRPIVHTFSHSVNSIVGATEDEVLKLWKEEWHNAGFDTIVLSLDDAKKHPNFEEVEMLITSLYGNTEYNAMGFYRWLAMAVSGGGWMSDNDTFPTNFPIDEGSDLPNGGNFISFQSHIPALMSGTAEEWSRVSRLIIDAIPRIETLPGVERDFISDRSAFHVLHQENNHNIAFVPFDRGVQDGYLYDSPRQVNCEKMSIGRAVHISHALTHRAVLDGVYPLEVSEDGPLEVKSHAEGSRIFMNDWRKQCTKPVMHTFFHAIPPDTYGVLELWKDEWSRAGFQPVVLTLDDAKRHPDFEEVETKMATLHGKTDYNALCFYRWLAMAVSGGGWMSDYDTYPVNFSVEKAHELPNGGILTSFQRHIPALISGSENEWDRVSKLLIDAIPRIEEERIKSDMHALDVLQEEHNTGIIFKEGRPGEIVQPGFLYRTGSTREVNCEQAEQTLALHMAHAKVLDAVLDGTYPLEITKDDPSGNNRRAEASKIFLDDIRAQCR